MDDALEIKCKEAGATLAKVAAESVLCENLFIGFLVLMLINRLGYCVRGISHVPTEYLIAIGAILVLVIAHRNIVYLIRRDRLVTLLFPRLENPIIVSYSSHDKEFANRLSADFRANGIRCWLAPDEIGIQSNQVRATEILVTRCIGKFHDRNDSESYETAFARLLQAVKRTGIALPPA